MEDGLGERERGSNVLWRGQSLFKFGSTKIIEVLDMVKRLRLWAHHGGCVRQFVADPLFLHRSQPSIIKRTHHKAGRAVNMRTKNQ